jgi:ribose 5-phosphate isomerase B
MNPDQGQAMTPLEEKLSEDQIRAMVRKVLLRTLGPNGLGDGEIGRKAQTPANEPRATVTETDVLTAPAGGELLVPPGAVITPLARDTALERRIHLVQSPERASSGPLSRSPSTPAEDSGSPRMVALGADHGGYDLKEDLKTYIAGLGYRVTDCGTNSSSSVDYPDFAYAVAQLVSAGQAWRGIIVDGAGIGSCMAANKVPGVRAAMCYDHATAANSREHNDANVLTLGGGLLGRNLARQIVKTWLETSFGGDRHARRVGKIMDIERRFLQR